jgi:hypothetical protein
MLSADHQKGLEVSTLSHQTRRADFQAYIVRDDGTGFGISLSQRVSTGD